MSSTTLGLEAPLLSYLRCHSLRDTDLLKRLRTETAKLPFGGMQVSPEQGQFMNLLVRITGATRIVEIGTFTGYSSLSMALALPDSGTPHRLRSQRGLHQHRQTLLGRSRSGRPH